MCSFITIECSGHSSCQYCHHSTGREQAALTGERLHELAFPYSKVVYSTMTRATETAKIILTKLENVEVEQCDLLREGAPIPPEPPIGSWKPEMHVGAITVTFVLCSRNLWG